MRSFTLILNIVLALSFLTSCVDNPKSESPSSGSAELEIVIPHYKDRYIYLAENNFLQVILRNKLDTSLCVEYIDGLTDNIDLSFIIKTDDSIYVVTRKQNGWAHNCASAVNLDPSESMIFDCNLIDYHIEKPVIRGDYHGWTGMPRKPYKTAQIKAIFCPGCLHDESWPSFPKRFESKFYNIQILETYIMSNEI